MDLRSGKRKPYENWKTCVSRQRKPKVDWVKLHFIGLGFCSGDRFIAQCSIALCSNFEGIPSFFLVTRW